jgi:toxin secretion/phage lysis holin
MKGGNIMNKEVIVGKACVTMIMAYISDKLGILVPIMLFLLICMFVDYITGIMAAAYEKLKYSDDETKGLNSRKGMMGIYKKTSYLFGVCVGIGLDWLILTMAQCASLNVPCKTFFGLLIALWYILNEMLSIIENLDKIDKIPPWLSKIVKLLQGKIDIKIEEELEKLDDDDESEDDDNEDEDEE